LIICFKKNSITSEKSFKSDIIPYKNLNNIEKLYTSTSSFNTNQKNFKTVNSASKLNSFNNNSMFENKVNDYLSLSSNNSANSYVKRTTSPNASSSCSDVIEENYNVDEIVGGDLNSSYEFTNILEKNWKTNTNKPKEKKLIEDLKKKSNPQKSLTKNCSTIDKSEFFDYESENNQYNSIRNLLNNETNNDSLNFNEKYKENLMSFLLNSKMYILLNKIKSGELTIKNLIGLEEEKLKSLIEKENLDKFNELKKFILNLDDAFDCDEYLKKIDYLNQNYI